MNQSNVPPKSSRRSRGGWIAAAGLVAVALAFAAGRLTSPEAPATRPATRSEPAARVPPTAPLEPRDGIWAQPGAPRVSPPVTARVEPAPLPQGPPRAVVSPVLLAQYRGEVLGHLEDQREGVMSACGRDSLPRGQRSATITYNVTFNPQGVEVGRGFVEDRRAPAGKLTKCLAQLALEPLTITPPPGTYVTLRVPVSYP